MAANANSSADKPVKVRDVITSFRPTRRFRPDDPKTAVTSMDFDDSGELLLLARDDETLQIYNCREGKHAKEAKSHKYGVHLARFTHASSAVIYASTKVDDGIRYLSTHDNNYIRYFRGHTARVTSLALSPSSDQFLSAAADNTMRLWDLRSATAQGQLRLEGPYLCTYDPSATVIAVASPVTQSVLLYDIRNYDKPPFATFDLGPLEHRFLPGHQHRSWSTLAFSNDGKSLLLGTIGAGHFLLDAFDGALKHFATRATGRTASRSAAPSTGRRAAGDIGPGNVPYGDGDVAFSPDGQYLLGGAGEHNVLVWDVHAAQEPNKVLQPMAELPGLGRASVVGYNPKFHFFCSADRNLMMWLPDQELLG
ncbi:WD repeat-containing protein 82 [Lineolata rhizophorae]|uniref:WD repeat-containing protein 82 n=1 Tax=Lineolata rhizophorae TaxID=578093 RepID=A0A6A6NN83_9PEZI|nr:WD repeat-containing protein 82 [Lineolata rhizophorae]